VVELDTNQRTRLTRDGRNSRPIWSADGRWIAYYKGDQLWALEVGAGREYLISDTLVDEFAWSPVQDQLAYLQLAYLSAASGLVVWRAIEQSAQNLVESEAMMTLVHFAWDPTGKWLACFNLVDNALKFTPPSSEIEVRAFEVNPWVVVEVVDNGSGIPPEDLPHIFEELYRGKNARGCAGSGLGLALVRAIVARHEGDITVRSRPGQGTVFTLRLPLAS
jgi:light-regulated signal transduction histidine kinase (bacteriophytochrome)